MRMLIKEFAEFTGVSIRTLRYYDEIGLLHPAVVDEYTGYRFYDENSAVSMQEIMFYRELDFPLKTIKEIMTSPDYDRTAALQDQKELLLIKKERLDRLIFAIDDVIKGRIVMKSFENKEFDMYKEEVKAKWGNTEAYGEYAEKSKNYSNEKYQAIDEEMAIIFKEFALNIVAGIEPDSTITQMIVEKLKRYITVNFYTCTKEILAGLGQMYVSDERFKRNIDKYGEGTAEYVSAAIEFYCKSRTK